MYINHCMCATAGRLDSALVARWCAGAAEDASLGAVARVLRAYRAACHAGDPQRDGNNGHDDADGGLRVASDAAFQEILVFTLREADRCFRRLLGVAGRPHLTDADFKAPKCASTHSLCNVPCVPASGSATAAPPGVSLMYTLKLAGGHKSRHARTMSLQPRLPRVRAAHRWRKVAPLVKTYLGNTLHLLAHLAEEATSTFILQRARASVEFLPKFEPLQKKFLKLVLGLFASSSSRRVRVQALLWLRELALLGDRKSLSEVLKGSYRAYAAHAAFVTAASAPDLAFMATGVVELYGLQPAAAYEHVFGFVAQLARVRSLPCCTIQYASNDPLVGAANGVL
jgi:nucleolar complex protein 2